MALIVDILKYTEKYIVLFSVLLVYNHYLVGFCCVVCGQIALFGATYMTLLVFEAISIWCHIMLFIF